MRLSLNAIGNYQRLLVPMVFLSFIGATGCDPKLFDQAASLQGTRTEELRDWFREDAQRDKLIVFVHGFNSSKEEAWGKFPTLLTEDDDFRDFNIHRFGYPTKLCGHISDIKNQGKFLASFLTSTFKSTQPKSAQPRYRQVTLVGHSMGGLVILHALLNLELDQRELLVNQDLKILTFGTPYYGVANTNVLELLCDNKQANDMAVLNDTLGELSRNWTKRFNQPASSNSGHTPQVPLYAFRGTQDLFTTETSACGYPQTPCEHVDGDHNSIVKPLTRAHLSYRKLKELAGQPRIPSTTMGKIGIWVARFTGDDESHAEQRGLTNRLEHFISQAEPQLNEAVEIRKLPVDIQGNTIRDKENEAKRLGEEYHAAIVVWGEVTKQAGVVELQQRVTLVKPLQLPTKTAVLVQIGQNSSQLPPLSTPPGTVSVPPQPVHQESVQLARFVLALTFIEQHAWQKAAKQLDLYLSAKPSEVVRSADIYFYAGLAHANEYSTSGTLEFLIQARDRYEKAVVGYQTVQDWMTYAEVLNNLGITYLSLAQREVIAKEIFDSSMAVLTETACRLPDQKNGPNYTTIQKQLGPTYWTLAQVALMEAACRFQERKNWTRHVVAQTNLSLIYMTLTQRGVTPTENLLHAEAALEEMAGLCEKQKNCEPYAVVLINLGTVYGMMAERGVAPMENLQKAMVTLTEAAILHKEQKDWAHYAIDQNNLGTTYRMLAQLGIVPKEHYHPAMASLTETACRPQDQKNGPNYTTIQKQLGPTYWTLAQIALMEASCRLQDGKDSVHYAMAQANLGIVYRMLVEYGVGPEENLRYAMAALTEAARVHMEQKDWTSYGIDQGEIGVIYLTLAERGVTPTENLQYAMAALTKAARLSKEQKDWAQYAITQTSLGLTYRMLAQRDVAPKENFDSAMAALRETACRLPDYISGPSFPITQRQLNATYWTLAEAALSEAACRFEEQKNRARYSTTKGLIGTIYLTLAERGITPLENLQYTMAVLTEVANLGKALGDWGHYAITQNNLGVTYRRLAQFGVAPEEHYHPAMAALMETACRFPDQKNGPSYATAHKELDATYWTLAEAALSEAACRFQEQKNWPRYKMAQENLGLTYRMMATNGVDPQTNLKLAEQALKKAGSHNQN